MVDDIETILNRHESRHRTHKVTSKPQKVGILLTNTGTPPKNTVYSLYFYLRAFLSDYRVIDVPRIIWWPVLYMFILTTRPFKKQKSYALIWNKEKNESPLRTIIRNQALNLEQRLNQSSKGTIYVVSWAFRYGGPDISDKTKELISQGCDRIISLPLFPQYSATTVASCNDQVFKALQEVRVQVPLTTISSYFNNPVFIDAVVKNIKNTIEQENIDFDLIIVTYHGIPQRYEFYGDPYPAQCHQTTELLSEALGSSTKIVTCFQSRFGPHPWTKPYTDKFVVDLAKHGYKKLLVVAPGFSADCLETLEELAIDLRDEFLHAGGDALVYVPCLNDSSEGIDVIYDVIHKFIE